MTSSPLTLEQRAQEWRQKWQIDMTKMQTIDAMTAAFACEQLEQACKAVCAGCAAGKPVVIAHGGTEGHGTSWEEFTRCHATPVRREFNLSPQVRREEGT